MGSYSFWATNVILKRYGTAGPEGFFFFLLHFKNAAFLRLVQAHPHIHQRVWMNNCFHPEIKAAQFRWVCVESLCFPLRLFIYPGAYNGRLTAEFFRESVLPLSQSLNLLAGLFSQAVSPGDIPCLKNYLPSPLPGIAPSNIFTRRSEVRTSSDRIHMVPILGGGDRCECLRWVGGRRLQINSACKSSARRRLASRPNFNPSTNHSARTGGRHKARRAMTAPWNNHPPQLSLFLCLSFIKQMRYDTIKDCGDGLVRLDSCWGLSSVCHLRLVAPGVGVSSVHRTEGKECPKTLASGNVASGRGRKHSAARPRLI